ncbi:MAG TPA: glycoside hydrolase family 5 protein [Verrucomicrobiae bacterium]|jgi:endoglucanase
MPDSFNVKSSVRSLCATLALCLWFNAGLAADTTNFVPSNPTAMKPLTNLNSPAHQAAKLFMRGVNLGNYLEAPPGSNWGVTCGAGEFALMRAEGFDHVRVPIGWHHYAGSAPEFTIAPEIFARADFVVTNAMAAKLAVIINIHHFDALTSDPAGQTEKFLAIWRQVAAHYAKFTNTLTFELLNEPKDAATTAVMNPIYAKAIGEIRKTNPHRIVFVGPGRWNSIDELKNLVLPDDDNLIVTVHCYDPFYFTHQGATWAGADTKVTGIQFPGPPAKPLVPDASLQLNRWVLDWIQRYNTLPTEKNPSGPSAFTDKLKFVRAWSDYYGRPVHLGEFGCFTRADTESRANFYAAFRRAADELKIGWAIWDWSAGFRYWDKRRNQPMPGMREALFGK